MSHKLRSSGGPQADGASVSALLFPPFRLDPVNEQLWLGERLIALKPRAFQLLRYLAERPRRLVGKGELFGAFWAGACVTEGVLKTQVRDIRRQLGDTSRTPRFIETVHRRGYRFIAEVSHELPDRERPALPAPVARASTSREIFVGRGSELSRLQDLWGSAQRGQRRLVFVTGEPGIGKTTLVSTFIDAQEGRQQASFAWGQCVEQYGPGEAYLPFLEAFGRACRGPDGAPVADVLRRKAPTWWYQLSDAPTVASTTTSRQANGAVPPERMLREMAEAIPELTAQRPLCIVLEDLHWADHSTLSLLSYLAQRADPARLLIVGTYRSRDVRSSDHPLWSLMQLLESRGHAEELGLRYLDDQDVRAYLAARFPQGSFPVELAVELAQLTTGNPLFLNRVVDVLLQRGLIRLQDDAWRFYGSISSIPGLVPDRLVLLIAGETERLTPLERSVLEAASVAGFEFSVDALAAALDSDPIELEELCTQWVRDNRFFRLASAASERGAAMRCEFFHALYRQVLYQRLAPTRRKQLHLRLGAYEERSAGKASQPPTSAGLLALHFRLGGEARQAARYGIMAGEHALRRSAYREAIAHFRTALETLDELGAAAERSTPDLELELELLVALSLPLLVTHGYAAPEVERVYLRATALCDRLGGPLQLHVMGGLTVLYLVGHNMSQALEMGQRFEVLANAQDDPELQFDAHLAVAIPNFYLGELAVAAGRLRLAVASRPQDKYLARASAVHPSPYPVSLCYLSYALWMLGYPDQAFERAEQALDLARRGAEPFTVACVLAHIMFVHKWRGDEQFVERARELAALAPVEEFWYYGMFAAWYFEAAAISTGDVERGIAGVRRSWGRLRAAGVNVSKPVCHVDLASACLAVGRIDEALTEVRAAFEASARNHERYFLPDIYRVYGEVRMAAPAGAQPEPLAVGLPALTPEAAFQHAIELARRAGAKSLELRAATSLGRLWFSHGRIDDARQLVGHVYASFSEGHATADLQRARALLATLDAARASLG